MKTLVVYFSYTGNNEALAIFIHRKLACNIFKIIEVRKRGPVTMLIELLFKRLPKILPANFGLDQYDHVIFIAPVWNGKIATPLKSFLVKEKNDIVSYSFITICSGRPGQNDWIRKELTEIVGKRPVGITELMASDVLPLGKSNKTNHHKLACSDLEIFNGLIDQFLREIAQEQNILSDVSEQS
jgi:hypothetical protein